MSEDYFSATTSSDQGTFEHQLGPGPASDEPEEVVSATPMRPHRQQRARRKRWLRVGAGVLVFIVLVAGGVGLSFTPVASVDSVKVSGTKLAENTDLNQALEPLQGKPVGAINTKDVAELLKGFPAVQDVRIQLDGPKTVNVEIVEHRQVAIMKQKGSDVIVGDNGVALKKVKGKDKKETQLPRVQVGGHDPDHEVFETVVKALAQLPPGVLKQLKQAEAKTVDTVQFTLRDGRTIVWGGPQDGNMKAALVDTFLNQAKVKDKVIDVSTPDRPVTRNKL